MAKATLIKVSVRLPEHLIAKIDQEAQEGVGRYYPYSRSHIIRKVLTEHYNAQEKGKA